MSNSNSQSNSSSRKPLGFNVGDRSNLYVNWLGVDYDPSIKQEWSKQFECYITVSNIELTFTRKCLSNIHDADTDYVDEHEPLDRGY